MTGNHGHPRGATHATLPGERVGHSLAVPLCICVLLVALSIQGQAGCCSCYPLKQGCEELSILARSRPIAEVLHDPATPADVRESLRSVQDIREFAERSLNLEQTRNYQTYCQTGGKPVAFMLIACPGDSLQPVQWWFPVAGSFPYLGFFDQADAQHRAARLKSQGFDVCVRTVAAYSTLGWLPDPVFSPMLRYDEATLANVIIHELAHATIYFPGRTDFNESVATFIGDQGSLDYISAKHGPDSPDLAAARESLHDEELFSAFMMDLSRRLAAAYEAAPGRAARLAAKRDLLKRAVADYAVLARDFACDDYRGFDPSRLNNAMLISHLTYHAYVELLVSLHERHGKSLANLVRFLCTVPSGSDPAQWCRDWLARIPPPSPVRADLPNDVYAARPQATSGCSASYCSFGPPAH